MQENIDDIVNDIRGNAEHNHALVEVSKYLTEIADRIEVARRDIDTVIFRYGRLVKKLRSENERLLSALKPVQDEHIPDFSICDTRYDRSECKGHEYDVKCEWYDIVESVRESQRIYKGGAK